MPGAEGRAKILQQAGHDAADWPRPPGRAAPGYPASFVEAVAEGLVGPRLPTSGPMAQAMVYLDAPGTVVRCLHCESVLMVFVRAYGRGCVDLRDLAALEVR